MARELKNKPLLEAILEVRWALQGMPPAPQVDPHYKLLLGRLFDRVSPEYPVYEQLPSANFPDELVGYIVQHRFRIKTNGWPLIQIGPGILTVNSTNDYKWEDFKPRIQSVLNRLYVAHPKVDELKITNLILRYIDAIEFDSDKENIFEFLKDKLKLQISLPDTLFKDNNIRQSPNNFEWRCSFDTQIPKGKINLGFANGQKNSESAIILETTIESIADDLQNMPKSFEAWLEHAHSLADDWFFKLIEGDLERRFSGE